MLGWGLAKHDYYKLQKWKIIKRSREEGTSDLFLFFDCSILHWSGWGSSKWRLTWLMLGFAKVSAEANCANEAIYCWLETKIGSFYYAAHSDCRESAEFASQEQIYFEWKAVFFLDQQRRHFFDWNSICLMAIFAGLVSEYYVQIRHSTDWILFSQQTLKVADHGLSIFGADAGWELSMNGFLSRGLTCPLAFELGIQCCWMKIQTNLLVEPEGDRRLHFVAVYAFVGICGRQFA